MVNESSTSAKKDKRFSGELLNTIVLNKSGRTWLWVWKQIN